LARAASQALEALIGEKVVDLTASRRCPHCGAVGVVKHGLDDNGQQRFRCRWAAAAPSTP
jgi:transposase-like protein